MMSDTAGRINMYFRTVADHLPDDIPGLQPVEYNSLSLRHYGILATSDSGRNLRCY